jgi:hypothetical protein
MSGLSQRGARHGRSFGGTVASFGASIANIVANARRRSVSVMMPTSRSFSITGSAPIRCASTSPTASAMGVSGPIVMTDRVMTRSTSNQSRM